MTHQGLVNSMDQDLFAQLLIELASLPDMDGVSMSEIVFLPEHLRVLMNWMVRENSFQFNNLAVFLKQDEENTHLILGMLVKKGLVEEVEGDEQEEYQIHLKASRNYQVPKDIWKVIDD